MKPGYKQTEVGVIPEDWIVCDIDSVVIPGKKYGIVDGPFGSNLKTIHYRKSGIPIITSGYVTEGMFVADSYMYVDKEKFHQEKRSAVYGGDIVMAKIGARCGASAILPSNHQIGILSGNALKIAVDQERHSTYYIWQVLWNLFTKGELDAVKTVGAQPAVSLANLKKYKIPLPSTIVEQTTIANALGDADALIQSLTRLIAKKRQIKQGAMQTLLNPYENGRLKTGWMVKKLSDICWFQEGPGLRNWQFTMSGMKVINVTNLENGYLNLEKTDRHISFDEFHKMYRHFEIDENDIVMASSGNSYSKVAVVRKQDLPLVMNTSVIRFKPLKGLQYNYLLIFLKSHNFKNQIDLLITGGAQPNFGPAHLKKIKIVVPEDEKEQTRIATILSGMDAEIAALEAKLAKYRHIKQGMMQNLLTGRIRLVEPETKTGAGA